MRAEFNQLKSNYQVQVQDLRKKLDTENKKRSANQEGAVATEQELIEASRTNFVLKTDVYQKEIDRTKFDNKKQQAERNIKLLTEKKKQLDAQISQAQQTEDT